MLISNPSGIFNLSRYELALLKSEKLVNKISGIYLIIICIKFMHISYKI